MHQIGIIGLGAMGSAIAENSSRFYSVVCYNRSAEKAEHFSNRKIANTFVTTDLKEFMQSITTPRVILIMIDAEAIGTVLKQLREFLSVGDIVIDGSNNYWKRDHTTLLPDGVHLVCAGVSGGVEGARAGPCIMLSGKLEPTQKVKQLLEPMTSQTDSGLPAVYRVGDSTYAHLVKTIHNAIEYIQLQAISELYLLLREDGVNPQDIASIFERWNQECESYLLFCAVQVLRTFTEERLPIVDHIQPFIESNGTGWWALQTASEYTVPAPLLTAALSVRTFGGQRKSIVRSEHSIVGISHERMKQALFLVMQASIDEGMSILQKVWDKNGISDFTHTSQSLLSLWTGGSIIRSRLLVHGYTCNDHKNVMESLGHAAVQYGLPVFSAAQQTILVKQYQAGSLIQGIRDYFGGHGYVLNNGKRQSGGWDERRPLRNLE